jgi:hypothetical protein
VDHEETPSLAVIAEHGSFFHFITHYHAAQEIPEHILMFSISCATKSRGA